MMNNNKQRGALSSTDWTRFDEGLVETRYTEQGEPFYVIRDGLDVEEYAVLAKSVLESENDIAHDFKGKVVSESGDREAFFYYKSGWFLSGLAEGEIE